MAKIIGSLSSIALTAAGALVANGSNKSTFGDKPISSAKSAAGIVTVGNNSMGSLSSTITGSLARLSQPLGVGLTSTLAAMQAMYDKKDPPFSTEMMAAWNDMGAQKSKKTFLQTVGVWGPAASLELDSVTASSFQTAIQMGITWAGKTLGGDGQLVNKVIYGNPIKITSILSASQGFSEIANEFIVASNQSSSYLAKTFTNMDALITGGLSGVSNWFEGLGEDVKHLGNTINWSELQNLGTPGQLLANIVQNGNLGPLYKRLGAMQISSTIASQLTGQMFSKTSVTLIEVGINIDSLIQLGADLPPEIQKKHI